ncbi:hypothetical protein EGH51_18580 [Klebsiella aerogenes]|nr:hypothetical protein EGH51_18580 [Klebsiella aerogenes]RSW85775.1 hypothetical protein EGH62_05620 [Klebsiella aerogenes]
MALGHPLHWICSPAQAQRRRAISADKTPLLRRMAASPYPAYGLCAPCAMRAITQKKYRERNVL